MYQVIAREYRPQTFSELVSQEHVRTTIENAIAQNRIAHGSIFSGQRGTGKTTVARARPLQGIHRRRSAPDHERSVQRIAEDAGGTPRVGGFRQ